MRKIFNVVSEKLTSSLWHAFKGTLKERKKNGKIDLN